MVSSGLMAFLGQSRGWAAVTAPTGLSVSRCPMVASKYPRSELEWAGEMAFCGSWAVCLLDGGDDGAVTVCTPAHTVPRRQGTCECNRQRG